MAKKLDSFLYVCLYMVIYWFSKVIVVSVRPLVEAIKMLIEGKAGYLRVWEYFVYSVKKADTSTFFVAIAALLMSLLLVWLIFVIRKKKFTLMFKAKKINIITVAAVFLLTFGFNAVALIVTKIPLPQYFYDSHNVLIGGSTLGSLWMTVLVAGIISPVFEELFFRGVIFDEFSSSGGFFFANFFQALFFGIMHLNLVQGLYAFVIGFSLGGVCRLSKTIYVPIAIHILFNLSNIFFGNYIMGFSVMSYFMVCGLIAFVLGFLLIWRK